MQQIRVMPAIPERVDAGAALLDEKAPGWFYRIDLKSLDLETEDRCMLGQLFGLFRHGLDALALPRNYLAPGAEAVPYGFDLDRTMSKDEYPTLTLAWKAVILERHRPTPATAPGAAAAGDGDGR